jgi:AraC-like DNA-binding protein
VDFSSHLRDAESFSSLGAYDAAMGKERGAQRWNQTGTASVVVLRPALTFARARGVNVEVILGAMGLSSSSLDEFDRRITEAARCKAWIEAAEQAKDPFFGLHVAEHAPMGAFDVLDYSLSASSTFDDALGHILRFHRVICDAWAYHLERGDSVARLRRIERTPPVEAEANLAFLVLRGRQLTGVDLTPIEVCFPHAAPTDTSYFAALFRCPVRFGQPASEIVLPIKDLALPVLSANPGLKNILDRYMADLLAKLPRSESFVERVRSVVARTICGGRPTLHATADRLHASPRTVQRRLGEHGTSHKEVVDSVRRELGQRLVTEGRMSITEIAFLLGFTDVSSFGRVYRRWTGVSPSRVLPRRATLRRGRA